MTFKTIETGSGGNAFLLDNLMIDCGLPYSKIKDHLDGVKYILLTHIHGDHFNKTAIRKIAANHEHIVFVCCEWLLSDLSNIIDGCRIMEFSVGTVYHFDGFKISPVLAYHDVPNCGYRIMKDGWKHLHITDTSTLEGITAYGYDSASIECNHHRGKALELIEQAKDYGEFSHLPGAINSHLSVEEVIEFCKVNKIKKLYPVHVGSSTKAEVVKALKEW